MTERLMIDVMMKELMKSSMIKSFITNPQTVFEEIVFFEFESLESASSRESGTGTIPTDGSMVQKG